MERVAVEAVETGDRPNATVRGLADELGTTDVAINHYHLEPGEAFASGMHTHVDQEEVFYVIEGTATFETMDGDVEVGADEVARFAPGEYQEGKNESDGRVRALALGAPQEAGETRSALPCEECGADYHVAVVDESGVTLECPGCGNVIEM